MAKQTDQFEAVNVGQVEIGNQSERGAVFAQNAEGVRGITRVTHGAAVVRFQRHLKSGNCVLAIFHEEDKWR